MNGLRIIICWILLLFLVLPVTAVGGDAISGISPSSGQAGNSYTVTITGANFTNTSGSVRFEKGSDDFNCNSPTTWDYISPTNKIVCKVKIPSNADLGYWNLIVVKGWDKTEILKTNAFAVSEEMSITSITPTSGRMETDVDFTIAGKNFNKDYIDDVFLSIDDFDTNISADDFKVDSSTKITGTFDLGDVDEEGDYDICIIDDFGSVECKKKAFEVITNAEGTLEIDSNPSGAAIYIDNVANGTTPRDIDILVGTYKVILKKAGYQDWSKTVNVQEDETTTIDATLYAAPTATPTQTQSTPYPTATPTTARTTIKSTMKIPTTYAEVPTTTAASPIEPWVIIGAVCLALIALRKR
ncbi:MAG: PEGA domain protein [Methanoregula sp. PtaU1.Bin006]|nr:MAG: PEGA domain protein [Methanoregula sp. PtaB.Bin085]OPY36028.1 MAG: PEGA domain protein [Methanoregula sp. PtaU1.Bin006]